MEYTVKELGTLSGVTSRTLRYYDQIGLLKPKRVTEAGYRLYGREQVERLQQILIFKNMGLGLHQIAELLETPDSRLSTLGEHLSELKRRRFELDLLIDNVAKTIAEQRGELTMTDQERFEGLKKQMIEENEKKYGEEIRRKYGTAAVERSNARLMEMTSGQMEEAERLKEEFENTLKQAMLTGNACGQLANKACDLHRQWLSCYSGSYSPEYHKGLGEMYVCDGRFSAYYDKIAPGCAVFLRDAIEAYCGGDSAQ